MRAVVKGARGSRPPAQVREPRYTRHMLAGDAMIKCAGVLRNKPYDIRDRTWADYSLLYLLEGTGTYEDPVNGRLQLNRGDVLVLFPDLRHSYYRLGSAWSECFLRFGGRDFGMFEHWGLLDRKRPIVSAGLNAELLHSFRELTRDGARNDESARGQTLLARVHWLAARALDLSAKLRERPTASGLVSVACGLLDQDFDRPVELASLARLLGTTEATLRRNFVRELGITPGRYRMLRRIERAKSLLGSDISIKEIAAALGYCDVYFFSRQFKSVAGQSPSAYRVALARTV